MNQVVYIDNPTAFFIVLVLANIGGSVLGAAIGIGLARLTHKNSHENISHKESA